MNICLICQERIMNRPSWKTLLLSENKERCCERCFNRFERINSESSNEYLDKIVSLYAYNQAMMEYLHQYKFLQDVALAQIFASELRTAIKLQSGIIVPIPMHPARLKERTFAHIDELLKVANIQFEHVLEKTTTSKMSEKTREERLAIETLFKIKEHGKIKHSSTYVLIDDIYTTGTTLRHAAKLLKHQGATRVEAITLIKAKLQKNGE